MWIVWNEGRTEAFVTHDEQLAYEVRKSADTNCVYESGYPAPVAVAFCNKWADDACEMFPYDPDHAELFKARDDLHKLEKKRAADIERLQQRIDLLEAQHRAAVIALGFADPDERRT